MAAYPKPAPRAFLCLLAFTLAVWSAPGSAAEKLLELDGAILPEASGLTASRRDAGRAWLINDSGNKAELIALDLRTGKLTPVPLRGIRNRDWEDLAGFTVGDEPWLAIGDIGDNRSRRKQVYVHLLPEPLDLTERSASVHTTLELTYPDGARDAESLAVDSRTGALYLLSKRDSSPRLYRTVLPVLPESLPGGEVSLALEFVGAVNSIPPPTQEEIERAPYGRFRAQPTSMTFSPERDLIAVLTYGRAYIAPLDEERDWLTALNTSLCPIEPVELAQGETIAFDARGDLLVSSEGKRAPLYRLAASCAQQNPDTQ